MRILLLMDPFIPIPPENYGGIERIVYDIATEYVKMGHSVTIVAGPNSKSPDKLITYGENGELNPNINFKHLYQVYTILNREVKKHDVIHNFGRLAFLATILRTDIRKVQSYLRSVSRFNIVKTDLLQPVNIKYTAVSEAIKKTGETSKSHWDVVYNCAPIDQFKFKADTKPDSYLAFIGRFERCKGLHNAIKVAKQTNRQLIIAGFISQIPQERRYYEREIKPFIDGEQIKWIGEVNNAQRNELLRNASALLTPVEWLEPFPVIIPEAYSCGTPVLGFARGGIPEGIEHGVTGFISNNINEMIEHTYKIDQLSRQACRDKAEREYSSRKIAENYFKLYGSQEVASTTSSLTPPKKKILLVMDPGLPVPPKFYGGHERLVHLFAEEYNRLGHEVTLLAGPDSYCSGKTITFGSNNLRRSGLRRLFEIIFVWRFLSKNKREFDLIHNFGRLIYLLPALNTNTKKVMSYGRKVTPWAIRSMSLFTSKNFIYTACSDFCVSTGNVAGNWRTVYNAIDFGDYQLKETLTEENPPLMFLGRLDKIKGAHHAIKVALATNNKLILAGNIPHTSDNLRYYKTEIEPLIDGEKIKYVGPLNDAGKNEYLGKAKALLFPIEGDEAFGLVMIEAMACGTPVIGFKKASVPEVIDEGITGVIVNDITEMANAIDRAASLDRKACRQQAEHRFNQRVIAQDYLTLFE